MSEFMAAILLLCRLEQAGLSGPKAKLRAEACLVEVKSCVQKNGPSAIAFEKCKASRSATAALKKK